MSGVWVAFVGLIGHLNAASSAALGTVSFGPLADACAAGATSATAEMPATTTQSRPRVRAVKELLPFLVCRGPGTLSQNHACTRSLRPGPCGVRHRPQQSLLL